MKKEDFKIEKFPEEIATELYEKAKDMDFMDYEDEKEQTISELENALYYLKTVCENEHNQNCFRTFYKILERI